MHGPGESRPAREQEGELTLPRAFGSAVDDHYLPELEKHYARDRASDSGFSPNSLTNVDGFGIGWFSAVQAHYRHLSAAASGTAGHAGHEAEEPQEWEPVTYKSARPPLHDANLVQLCGAIESPVVFGHIRMVRPGVISCSSEYSRG